MGIVLKRRDNAPIVKIVCGGIIDQILNKRSPQGAVEFTRKSLKLILMDKYPIEKYIITKTLKDMSSYKDPASIVHAVLAEIMAERDSGNKPQANDRIPYVYKVIDEGKVLAEKYKKYVKKKNIIYANCECDSGKCTCYMKMCKRKKCVNNKKCTCHEEILQGDRVEHPAYLLEHKLRLDYLFYITNQIMKPAIQFLELIIEKPEEIFNEYIVREENRRENKIPIEFFFNDNLKSKELKKKLPNNNNTNNVNTNKVNDKEDENFLLENLQAQNEKNTKMKAKKKIIFRKKSTKEKNKKTYTNNFEETDDGFVIGI
jgi:hypothetical protein